MCCRVLTAALRPWWVLAALVFLGGFEPTLAATVTNNNDAGPGSLRGLIAAAGSGDTIDFHPSVTGTIALTSGVLNITQPLIITGPGSAVLTISGSNTGGVFEISSAGALTISDLTLSDGVATFGGAVYNNGGSMDMSDCVLSDNAATGLGGAIYNDGTLTVSNTTFNNNDSAGSGGGVLHAAGVSTISDSQFVGNQANSGGGGIFSNDGSVTLTRTTFDGNIVPGLNGGGGVMTNGDTTISVTDCTFKNNTAFDGGGMHVNGGTAVIERTTFSNNTAVDAGGGLWGPNNAGSLTITNSTVSNNTALYTGGFSARYATTISSCTFADNEGTSPSGSFGGNLMISALGPTTIENTLVAGGIPWNCFVESTATYTSSGHNLDTGTTCGFNATGDLSNATAGLDVLANYGGPTFTRALLGNSNGTNAGNTATCPPTDQRGVARPIGAACDIGAFEGSCGDGNPDPGEVCDDGNATNGDGCDVNCTVTACGNGITTSGEQCDDGNTSNGDCCDATCQYESNGSPCVGTTLCATTCNGAGACAPAIRGGCRGALKSILLVKNQSGDSDKDKLLWKWVKGDTTMLADFGSPSTTTQYTLCVFAGTSPAVTVEVAPSASLWSPVGTKGLKYKDLNRTSNGVGKVLLKAGAAGKAKALLKGKGVNLPDPPVGPLALPVTAQLVNSTNSVCYEGVYDTPDIIKNETEKFKAKAQ